MESLCEVQGASRRSPGVSEGSGSAIPLEMFTAVCMVSNGGGVSCGDYSFKGGNLKSV